jgi:hypothetical protein
VTRQQIASADYGSYPTNYEEKIKAYFDARLKDPYSAHYRFGVPHKGYTYLHGTLRAADFGYLVNVYINAKNSFGGYTGEELHIAFIKNDQVWETAWMNAKEVE